MTEETRLNQICKKCGKPFKKSEEGADDETLLCPRCLIELAEQKIPEEAKSSKSQGAGWQKAWTILRLIILIASVCIIGIQAPKLVSAISKQKPIRNGAYETDAKTDKCIKNLWHISSLLQEGRLPEKNIVCPLSKKPYVIRDLDTDIVVSCPNPGLHGFKEIQVAKSSPCPRLKK
jgi:hypothetical protein